MINNVKLNTIIVVYEGVGCAYYETINQPHGITPKPQNKTREIKDIHQVINHLGNFLCSRMKAPSLLSKVDVWSTLNF